MSTLNPQSEAHLKSGGSAWLGVSSGYHGNGWCVSAKTQETQNRSHDHNQTNDIDDGIHFAALESADVGNATPGKTSSERINGWSVA